MQRFCLAIALSFFAVSSAFGFSINDFTKTSIPINGTDGTGIPAIFAADIDNNGTEEIFFTRIGDTITDPTDDTAYAIYVFDSNGNDITSKYFDTEVKMQSCKKVFAQDFNGDGKRDIMFLTQGMDVHPIVGEPNRLFLSNTENNILTEKVLPGVKDYAHEGSVGDIDNDGDLDVLVIAHGDIPNCYFYINDGLGNFTQRILFTGGDIRYFFGSCSLADMDNDGNVDLVLGIWDHIDAADCTSVVIFGDGTGAFNFADRVELPLYKNMPLSEISTYVTRTYDINNDGNLDIIFGMYDSKCNQFAMQILKNKGDRTFEDVTDTVLPVNHITGDQMMFSPQIFQYDIDRNGYKDIVFGQMSIFNPTGVSLPSNLPFSVLVSGDTYSTKTTVAMFPNLDVTLNNFISTLIPIKVSDDIKFVASPRNNTQFVLNLFTRYIAPTGTPSSGGGGGCSIGSSALMIVLLLPVIALKRLF